MRKLISLILALLMLTGAGFAAEPANPADPAMAAELLPGYAYVDGVNTGDDLRLLMHNPDGALVFIGGVRDDSGQWRLTESTPLPEGSFLTEEHGLSIPVGAEGFIVDLQPYADGTWGLSRIIPAGIAVKAIDLHKHVVYYQWMEGEKAILGDHPWSDITVIDWTNLPATYDEAAAAVDNSHWAVTSSPDPLDLVRLRENPSTDADVLGSYYNCTPVYIRQVGETWCAVTVGGVEGWMMTRYLVNGANMGEIPSAAPIALPIKQETQLHVRPSRGSDYVLREMEYPYSPYILGKTGYWYHVWLPDTEEYGYVHMDDV